MKYLKSARRKIKNKTVIGITGSGGKTSVKNMIYDVLINEFNVSKTPKSYNNRVGIVKSINEEVNKSDEYFICEYGVDKRGGMDKLLSVVKPNVAIITYIGNQHLLTFKSVENIFKEKIKLVDGLKENGVAIINNDCSFLREYNYKNKRVIRYGIEYQSDVMAKNIFVDFCHSEYDLYIKDTYITRVNMPLLSIHSVENSLAVVATLLALNVEVDYIVKYINRVNKVANRLEYKKILNMEVIDDSFNSNIKGFINALNVLKTSAKYKVVITPGIIEQGKNSKNINNQIAKNMVGVNMVCLVGNNSLKLKRALVSYDFKNIKTFNNFNEAFEYTKSINEEKIVLIENDLPNIYLK